MKAVIKILVITLIGSTVFFSCSTERKAKRLIRQGKKKIHKALTLAPNLADTINRATRITVEIPGVEDSLVVKTDIDTTEFKSTLNDRDSLKNLRDSLENVLIEGYHLRNDKEKIMQQLRLTQSKLNSVTGRLSQGFTKDSLFNYEDDRIELSILVNDGLLSDVFWHVKPVAADTVVKLQEVKIYGTVTKVKGFSWWVVVIIFFVALFGGYIISKLK